MTNEAQPPQMDNTELTKQAGKVLLKGTWEIISGHKSSAALKWAAIGFRIFGVAVFIMALFKLWYFAPLAETMGWFRTVLYGLVTGFLTYCTGDLINLLINMEAHLRKMAGK